MEISKALNFLTIFVESIRLLFGNGKFMVPITILFLLVPSILVLIYSFFFQLLMNRSQTLSIWVYLVVEVILLIAYVGISLASRIATISVLSMSYAGNTPSIHDLFSKIKRSIKSQLCNSFNGSSCGQTFIILSVGVFFGFVVIDPNTITIVIAVLLGIIIFTYSLYIAVVLVMAIVVSVVEEIINRSKAVERAGELVEGQRIHGFLINLFLNLIILIVFFGYWMMIWCKGYENLTVAALVFVNTSSLLQISVLAAYIVFYFQCKKQRGEEIVSVGDVTYTKLPTDDRLVYDVV